MDVCAPLFSPKFVSIVLNLLSSSVKQRKQNYRLVCPGYDSMILFVCGRHMLWLSLVTTGLGGSSGKSWLVFA